MSEQFPLDNRSDDMAEQDRTKLVAAQAIGTVINQYRLERMLGAGGMGEVYLAEDARLGRQVALKLLPLAFSADAALKSRLEREAKAAAAINHPNILTIYEIGEASGRLFIAMEHVDGSPLSEITRKGPLPITQVLDIVCQICAGLQEAHRKGVIHRDIKPSNILVTTDGRVKIVDFGLAKVEAKEPITQFGVRLGTPGYMSPEQIAGQEADVRSDLFAFGVLLYELLAGKNPFLRGDELATLYAIVHDQPAPLASVRPDTPAELERVVGRLLEKTPRLRYATVEEVLQDIRPILAQQVSPHAAAVPATPQIPSIAVLPFTDMSAKKDQEYFCDGITEEIINALSHLEGIRVVSRTSSFQFKGKELDIRRIGDQLNVTTVLEGSLRTAGDRLRITAQLIKVADGFHMWSEKYDRKAEDIFDIQDDIARTIVDTLRVKLLAGETPGLTRKHTDNLEAYHLYLHGRYLWNQRSKKPLMDSLEYFKKALELDPSYALAYVGLSDSYFVLAAYDFLDPKIGVPAARQAVLKALQLDDTLAEAHTALAGLLVFFDLEWVQAEKEFKRAIELNSGYGTAYQWYAEMQTFQGRYEEARRNFEAALDLDPLSHIHLTMFGFYYAVIGDLRKSSELFTKAIELGSQNYNLIDWHALNQFELGNTTEAMQWSRKALEIAGKSWYPPMIDSFLRWRQSEAEPARSLLARLETESSSEFVPPSYLYILNWYVGERERAYYWLQKTGETKDLEILFLILPSFKEAMTDPKAQELLHSIGVRWQAS